MMDPGRPAAAQDDGDGSGGIIMRARRTQTPDRPQGRGVSHQFPEWGCAEPGGARIRAARRCRMSVSECRCSADLAPPGSARGCFGCCGRSSLAGGTHHRSTSGSPRPRRRRLPKPATTPGRTMPRDSPLGRVQRGEDRGGRGSGDKGRRLCPEGGWGRDGHRAEAQRSPSRPRNGIASSRIFLGLIASPLDQQYLLLSEILTVKRNTSVP